MLQQDRRGELADDAPIFPLFQSLAQHLSTWQLYTLTMMGAGASWFQKKAARDGVEPEREEDGSIKRTYGLGILSLGVLICSLVRTIVRFSRVGISLGVSDYQIGIPKKN